MHYLCNESWNGYSHLSKTSTRFAGASGGVDDGDDIDSFDDLVGKKIDHSDRFMDWGPTTDDSYVKGVVEGANITLICRLVSGEFVIVEMPTQQLIETYQSVAKELRALHA